MSERPAETHQVHTRLLKCALQIEDSRAFWSRAAEHDTFEATTVFSEYWLGAKSLARVKVLLTNFRARFTAFPPAVTVLAAWSAMPPDTRALICHWHLQLSDPLYRCFTGEFLPGRIDQGRPTLTHGRVIDWVSDQGEARWTMATRRQFGSKLLSCAHDAGLVKTRRDPRPLTVPRVSDDALTYLLHLLRGIDIAEPLLDNAYLRSVGLTGSLLTDRLRRLPHIRYRHSAGVSHVEFHHPSLQEWAQDTVAPSIEAGASP